MSNVHTNGLVRRLTQLYIGLLCYGVSSAMQVKSGLGLDPWDVFHQGISRRLSIPLGLVVIIVGGLVLSAWIPLHQRPGLGTISNVVLVGTALGVGLDVLPTAHLMFARVAYVVGGIVLCGIATGMYISADFGPGPRDGLMTGIPKRTGLSIRVARTGVELTVLAVGFLLGGTVGIGTLIYALSIGPLAQLFLRVFTIDPTRAPIPVE